MANFTTENNTYCFRIGPAFLDTIIELNFWYLTKRRRRQRERQKINRFNEQNNSSYLNS